MFHGKWKWNSFSPLSAAIFNIFTAWLRWVLLSDLKRKQWFFRKQWCWPVYQPCLLWIDCPFKAWVTLCVLPFLPRSIFMCCPFGAHSKLGWRYVLRIWLTICVVHFLPESICVLPIWSWADNFLPMNICVAHSPVWPCHKQNSAVILSSHLELFFHSHNESIGLGIIWNVCSDLTVFRIYLLSSNFTHFLPCTMCSIYFNNDPNN